MTGFTQHITTHRIAPVFFRHPWMVRLSQRWNYIFFNRNWFIQYELFSLLESSVPQTIFCDLGCGNGQHLIPARAKGFKQIFYAVDKSADNLKFIDHYFTLKKWDKPKQFHLDLEKEKIPEADIYLAAGVLQYIQKDTDLLQRISENMKPNGSLILYCPVENREILRFYKWMYKRVNHYEKANNRVRVYSETELKRKLSNAGFIISKQIYVNDTPGILGHECYNLLLYLLIDSNPGIKLLGIIGAIPLLVASFLLKWMDLHRERKQGNGILLICRH